MGTTLQKSQPTITILTFLVSIGTSSLLIFFEPAARAADETYSPIPLLIPGGHGACVKREGSTKPLDDSMINLLRSTSEGLLEAKNQTEAAQKQKQNS